MAQRSERCNFRAEPERAERYRAAAAKLGLEEASDFYRRACDDLADRVLTGALPVSPAAHAAAAKPKTVRPLSKKEQASGRSNRS